MSIIELLSFEKLKPYLQQHIQEAKFIVFDANLTIECITGLCEMAAHHKKPVWFNPTSIFKAQKAVQAQVLQHITYMSPNTRELKVLAQTLNPDIDSNDIAACTKIILDSGVKNIILTQGENGISFINHSTKLDFSALPVNIVNVTGAGDALASGMIHILSQSADPSAPSQDCLKEAIEVGLRCAKCALESEFAVNPNIKYVTQRR